MKTILRVVILFVAVVRSYDCADSPTGNVPPPDLDAEKKIFDSEERKEDKFVDFEKSPLFKLDEQVVKELRDPRPPDVSFEVKLDVLRNLDEYEKHFKELLEGVQNDSPTGKRLAQDVLLQDGPKFLREEIDEERLKKVYNWDDENIEHITDLFTDIKSIYNNITASLKEKPGPLEIFFSKTKNSYAK